MNASIRNQLQAVVLGGLTAIGATGCGQGLQPTREQPGGVLRAEQLPPGLRHFAVATPTAQDREQARIDCKRFDNVHLFSEMDKSIADRIELTRRAALSQSSDFSRVETRPRDPEYCYARAVLDELRNHSQCDRYVAALRHVLGKHPGMRDQCLELIGTEQNGRFGDKGADLLYYFARCRPTEAATLASRVGRETTRIFPPGSQKGFPEVAAEMRQIAQAHSSRSR